MTLTHYAQYRHLSGLAAEGSSGWRTYGHAMLLGYEDGELCFIQSPVYAHHLKVYSPFTTGFLKASTRLVWLPVRRLRQYRPTQHPAA